MTPATVSVNNHSIRADLVLKVQSERKDRRTFRLTSPLCSYRRNMVWVLLRSVITSGIVLLYISILFGGHVFHNHANDEECTAKCPVHQWIVAHQADGIPTVVIPSPAQTVDSVFQAPVSLVSFDFLPFCPIRAPPAII